MKLKDIAKEENLEVLNEAAKEVEFLSEEWFVISNRIRDLLSEKYPSESVLVIPRDFLPTFIEEGFTPFEAKGENLEMILSNLNYHSFFMPRYQAEYNPTFKQIIPYVVIKSPDKIFAMQRITGDLRLTGNVSVGVGGHINPIDEKVTDRIYGGMKRELNEEVSFLKGHEGKIKFIGFISDNSNSVSQDHLGLVYLMETEGETVEIKEKDVLSGSFLTKEELKSKMNTMESWTSILMPYL